MAASKDILLGRLQGGMDLSRGDRIRLTFMLAVPAILAQLSMCLMSYIDGDSDVAVGDKVLTSGVGSIYPRGILIGTVTLVSADPVSRTVNAVIEPAADLSNITRVMIITEYSVCTDETNP